MCVCVKRSSRAAAFKRGGGDKCVIIRNTIMIFVVRPRDIYVVRKKANLYFRLCECGWFSYQLCNVHYRYDIPRIKVWIAKRLV